MNSIAARLRSERLPQWTEDYATPWALFDLKNGLDNGASSAERHEDAAIANRQCCGGLSRNSTGRVFWATQVTFTFATLVAGDLSAVKR